MSPHPGHPGHPGGDPVSGHGSGKGRGSEAASGHRRLFLLAWETTQACTLACPHCRASACPQRPAGELTTEEGKRLLEEAARVGPSIVILSGGEPLLRDDLEILAAHAGSLGHTPVVSTNDGNLLTAARIASLQTAGVKRFSFSIHADSGVDHDAFVALPGAFRRAEEAFDRLRSAGLPFQINTTVLPRNVDRLAEIRQMAMRLGAAAWHLFFVVPTGRAAEASMVSATLPEARIEAVLRWAAELADDPALPMKITCAPQYARIRAQLGKKNSPHGRSCMAGDGFAFVSAQGDVKPCGYFDLVVGNVRTTPFDRLYLEAPAFVAMRNPDGLKGICGGCAYRRVCGGCRARAQAVHHDFLGPDPNCNYSPAGPEK